VRASIIQVGDRCWLRAQLRPSAARYGKVIIMYDVLMSTAHIRTLLTPGSSATRPTHDQRRCVCGSCCTGRVIVDPGTKPNETDGYTA
jgi:hypothetical protein